MNKTDLKKNKLLKKVDSEKVDSERDLLLEVYNGLDYLNYVSGNLRQEKKFTYRIVKNMVDVAVESKLALVKQGDVYFISDYILDSLEEHNYKLGSIYMVRQYVYKIINNKRPTDNNHPSNNVWNDDYPFPF